MSRSESRILQRSVASVLLSAGLLMCGFAAGAVTINVIGTTPPVPGADDQYQTNYLAAAQSPPPGGGAFNYYLNADPSPGQTFTTGSNPTGYTLSSLSLYDSDNTGGGFGNETFTLGIYSINGSTATLITTFTSQSIALTDFAWFQWTNLNTVVLQPNTQYAYAMWANGSGWCNLGSVSNATYSGGEVAIVPRNGGAVTVSSDSNWDAAFIVGLTPITAVTVGQTTFSTGSSAVVPGTSVTASAAVNGPAPYSFQWLTDGGTGGALTNIPGATSSNLVINTTGFADGYYQYALLASNNTSSATGHVGILQVQHPVGIAGVIGVKFTFAAGYATQDHLLPADNTGVATGQIVPPANVPLTAVGNWNNLFADVATAGSQSAAINQTWPIDHDSTGTPLTNVTLTAAGFDDGWFSGGTGCAAGRLLYDCWKFNTSNGQNTGFGHAYASLNISGLTDGVTERAYDVIVYINDNNGNYWGNVSANSKVAVGNNVDVDGFNGASSDPCSLGTPLHTAAGFGNPANYVIVPGVTTSGGAIQIDVVMIGGGDFGVSGIELVPLGDLALSQDILPRYAETVAGDQVVFTAAITNTPPISVQWQKIDGGATNNINAGVVTVTNGGVVQSTLTLNNVQSVDSGSYQIKVANATNSSDFIYSSAAPLVIASAPVALGNINQYYASQTLVSGLAFYPPWSVNTTNDLIYNFVNGSADTGGQFVAGTGNFGLDTANSDPTILSDGGLGLTFATLSTCGNPGAGESMTYTLITNSAPFGYEITNITVFGGWLNNNRDEQKFEISYSTVSNPTNFVSLVTPDYNPTDPSGGPSATRVTLVPAAGVMAHNVYEIRFNFNVPNIENGYEGYSELAVFGTPASFIQPVAPTVSAEGSSGALVVSGTGGTPNSGYTLLETTNLTAGNWLTNFSGVLDGTGSFTNTIPVSPIPPTRFFRARVP